MGDRGGGSQWVGGRGEEGGVEGCRVIGGSGVGVGVGVVPVGTIYNS